MLTRAHGGKVRHVWESAVHGFSIEATAAEALAITNNPWVQSVEEDEQLSLPQVATCAQTTSRCADGKLPWNLDRIDQWSLPLNGQYWHVTPQSRGAVIFNIDSGIVASHSEFNDANGRTRVMQGKDFVNDGQGTNDCYSHGTYTASMAVGRTAGVAREARIVPVRVADCAGNLTVERIVDGVNWVKDNFYAFGLYSIANIEAADGSDSPIMRTAIANLGAAGVIVTVPAGNKGGNACSYSPSNTKGQNVVIVAASTSTDNAASFTNQGSCVTVFAPGAGVGGDAYSYDGLNCSPGWNGTSVAAPIVAGVFAMYWMNHSTLSARLAINQVLGGSTVGELKQLKSDTQNLLIANPYDPWMSCDTTAPPPDVR